MENKINQEEINTLLAKELRDKGLDNVLQLSSLKTKIMQKIKEMNLNGENTSTEDVVTEMENPRVSLGQVQFPNPAEDEEQFKVAPDINTKETPKVGIEAGSQPLNTQIPPKMAIIPEIPDFLKEVQPGKVFVYDFNELSVGGENLSNCPFKTLENPDVSKSMQQMWSENGITKAEVYQTKFEKIGEIIFDYKSGSSQFMEINAEPDFDIQQQYKQNPYAADPEKEIENYLKNDVDLDKKVNDVITNIVKSYFLTNTERAAIPPQPQQPAAQQNAYPVSEGSISTTKDMVEKLKKIDSPKELIETIQGKSKAAVLISDNKDIKVYKINEIKYFLPSDPMSIRKCYVE